VSPTARSLLHLRKRGCLAATVERWNPHAKVRQDLWGFGDILAVEPGRRGCLIVQACVTGDQSKRLAKIAEEPRVKVWLKAGNRVAVWGWSKRGQRDKRKLWLLSETRISLNGDVARVEMTEVAG